MRGLFVVLSLGTLKALYMRYFLRAPGRRNQVSPDAVSNVRLTPDGGAQPHPFDWPKRSDKRAETDGKEV